MSDAVAAATGTGTEEPVVVGGVVEEFTLGGSSVTATDEDGSLAVLEVDSLVRLRFSSQALTRSEQAATVSSMRCVIVRRRDSTITTMTPRTTPEFQTSIERAVQPAAGRPRVRRCAREMTPELEQLVTQLDGLRTGVVKKLAGLSEVDARRTVVGTGTNLAGLLQHLTFVESKWLEEVVAGGSARGERSMQVDPTVSLRTLRANYRAACRASDEIIRAVGDADAAVAVNGGRRNLRSVLLAVIEETARHAGHADIIREQIDGQTGR